MKRIIGIVMIALFSLLLLSLIAFLFWARSPFTLMPEVAEAMESDGGILVSEQKNWIIFEPTSRSVDTALIVYPGTRVDAGAYAPVARNIALGGYLVILVDMPLNLSVLGIHQAEAILEAFDDVAYWGIAGHSMGGAMAAFFVEAHPRQIDGLLFWASYPPEGIDLTGSPRLKVMSIYAEFDGLATPGEVMERRGDLPGDSIFREIPGGNHAQFAYYGDQKGDSEAIISYQEQSSIIVEHSLRFLESHGP